MKYFYMLIILLSSLSCYNGLNDMLGDLEQKVPICVDSRVAASGDGRGWENAYKTINEAVSAAKSGDVIWVAGTHVIESTIFVTKPLFIYGGFRGIESRIDERDAFNNPTELDGPSAVLIMNISSISNVNIDGFLFNGGGYSSQPVVDITLSASINFSNCIFQDGYETSIQNSNITFEKCNFSNNRTGEGEQGGAISATNNSVLSIVNCTFTGNTADQQGGAIYSKDGIVYLIDSIFEANESSKGGALFLVNSTTQITGSKFINNSATGSYGGAIFLDSTSKISIKGCEFKSNYGKAGGAICAESVTDSYNIISNSLFYDNISDGFGTSGSAIMLHDPIILCNLTFYFNKNINPNNPGGTIRMGGDDTIIYNFYNLVFYGNTDAASSGVNKNISKAARLNIYNSFYYGGISVEGPLNSPNCIPSNSSNPFLSTDPSDSNFLRPNSLIINNGLNTISGFTMPATDLAGNPRIVGGTVDMGAYESQ